MKSRQRTIRRLSAVVGAVVAALVVWVIAVPILGIDLTVLMAGQSQTVGVLSIVIVAALAALAAWGVLAILERAARRPGRVFLIIALVFGVLSLLGPVTSANSVGAGVVLCIMHLAVAATVTATLVGSARSRRAARTQNAQVGQLVS